LAVTTTHITTFILIMLSVVQSSAHNKSDPDPDPCTRIHLHDHQNHFDILYVRICMRHILTAPAYYV
jgi:hypothetical protein